MGRHLLYFYLGVVEGYILETEAQSNYRNMFSRSIAKYAATEVVGSIEGIYIVECLIVGIASLAVLVGKVDIDALVEFQAKTRGDILLTLGHGVRSDDVLVALAERIATPYISRTKRHKG